MAQALINLSSISTGYTVFEKDQVLTEGQLNSVSTYLDDQERLARVSLSGVGISHGLQVSLASNRVTVTRGVGVTTDGDLARLAADVMFDRFKEYDAAAPDYAPFGIGPDRIPLFELVQANVQATGAVYSLGELTSRTQRTLGNMVAVLLMESYEADEDLCSGSDCDNLGKTVVNTPKVLLVDRANVSRLKEVFTTPDRAARALSEVVVDRPAITAAASSNDLAAVYRTACTAISQKLSNALSRLWANCAPFLSDLFVGDPTFLWLSRLTLHQGTFASRSTGIQYYYDFLKDVAETHNAFRELLFGETTVGCPDVGAFPKHLLLGGVTGGTPEERTGYYPAPAASSTSEQLRHARFLALKLHALIQTFVIPAAITSWPVRVTPSLFEDQSLEERAIPYYYEVNASVPIHRSWSYARSKRGEEATHYSYNAAKYNAQGAAANPLASQLGRFPFFRIEGHLGGNVDTVLATLQAEIRARNLPFIVRSLLLDTDRTRLPRKRKRYTDLHRIHHMVRQELSHQMDDVISFSTTFKNQVISAVDAGRVRDVPEDGQGTPTRTVKETANQKNSAVTAKASGAKTQLAKKYADYQANRAVLRTDLRDAMQAAGEFKYELGNAVKTEFVTPFDAYIGNTHHWWLDWLDEEISLWDGAEDDKLLFNKFLADHPGAEHFAGVVRGGTFVLVYDATNTVVADFMLTYHCPEPVEQEVDEKPLVRPEVKPAWIVDNGIKVLAPVEKYVRERLDIFRADVVEAKVEAKVKEMVKPTEDYFRGIKESFDVIVTKSALTETPSKIPGNYLDLNLRELEMTSQRVDFVRNQLIEPGITEATKTRLRADLTQAQQELAAAISMTARTVAASGKDVEVGSVEYKALTEAGQKMMKLDSARLTTAKNGLKKVSTTDKPQLASVLTNMLTMKGV
ncbi:hypothetical protein LY474_08000 [Myxococcus stipitatus]|uniref:hypothetical protein n=1 Tax=Myxococcus stipitatus TaxID=83455 RepID=UPI001F342DA2|nr:hypothetical protein [Myxococcus stipitatus]MCE9667753.1 hypothetical protein [Myxococcus stipitatus]